MNKEEEKCICGGQLKSEKSKHSDRMCWVEPLGNPISVLIHPISPKDIEKDTNSPLCIHSEKDVNKLKE